MSPPSSSPSDSACGAGAGDGAGAGAAVGAGGGRGAAATGSGSARCELAAGAALVDMLCTEAVRMELVRAMLELDALRRELADAKRLEGVRRACLAALLLRSLDTRVRA